MCSTNLSIDIPFSTPVITHQAAGIILRTVIEFLAFYKKQIPFPYDMFKLMTGKIRKQISNDSSSDDWLQMQIERQQALAIETFDNLNVMLESITNQLEKMELNQAVILFGATSLTPKEAFLINIPPITKNHHYINHQESIQRIARTITMSILTSQKFYEIESKLATTNMFVLLKPKVAPSKTDDSFQLTEDFRLPRSCKTVILNLQNTSNSIKANCCEHLVVYDDLLTDYGNLSVTDEKLVPGEDDDENEMNDDSTGKGATSWYNSTVFVRGFKDVLVKGKSIWNC
ncbi:hypothetical protein HA402_000263 [Bradysia odoriphaga]|nr:hypothetical protein HA402_000263 [Bradysia odoriphaga]